MMTTYYETHKDRMIETQKQWELAHKEERSAYKADWYNQNVDRIKTAKHMRVLCTACNKTVCAAWMSAHYKTKKHIGNVGIK